MPPETFARPHELALAYTGLSGICGALLMPTIMAWLRLGLRLTAIPRSALSKMSRLSGSELLRCAVWTLGFCFFVLARSRAVSEYRELRLDAPVFANTVTGILVGLVVWAIYATVWSALRVEVGRARQRRQVGPLNR